MRLPEGICVDAEATFGNLKFSALRREVFIQDEEGNSTGEIKCRTYDLKCEAQGMMIQVSIPADVAEKTFDYNTLVELVEPYIDTVATATYRGRADAGWYIRAKDIVKASESKAGKKETEESGTDAAGAQNKPQAGQTAGTAPSGKKG